MMTAEHDAHGPQREHPRTLGEPRNILTAANAIEIYSVKTRKTPRDSRLLAAHYGITSRTVRNIV